MSDKLLLTVFETAELISVKKSKAYKMVAQGVLPSVRLGPSCIRVPRQALEQWVAKIAEGQGAPVNPDPPPPSFPVPQPYDRKTLRRAR